MKHTTLQLHKEATMMCEEIMTLAKAQSALLIPLVNKTITTSKPLTKTRKASKNYTNYGRDNHIVDTCRVKPANYINNKGYQLELESSYRMDHVYVKSMV